MPLFAAFVARMEADEKIHLAAYSSIVFPVSLVIEGPIIMLLAASTALSTNWSNYRKLRRFMNVTSALLTALHVIVAFTPVFDFVARHAAGRPRRGDRARAPRAAHHDRRGRGPSPIAASSRDF